MTKFLKHIETHAARFGLFFNKSKCVSFPFNSDARPKFSDGTPVPTALKAKYLGGVIHSTHRTQSEIQSKIGSCFAVLNRLNFFWRKSNCPRSFKLRVFDAVVRSKLAYGLETIFTPPPLLAKLDVFQLKGLRKILVMDTTFINRANTNAKVFENATRSVNPNLVPNKSIPL